jgi:hypothetical protein
MKLSNALRGAIVKAAVLLLMFVGLSMGCTPAYAGDCSFDTALDAKVIRFAWPPAVGINALGFVDFEVGYAGGLSGCGNATVDALGGICLIPKVGDLLGPMCSAPAEPDPE